MTRKRSGLARSTEHLAADLPYRAAPVPCPLGDFALSKRPSVENAAGSMKKIFPLTAPDRAAARVVDRVKADVRRYVQRERRKALPEGFAAWSFACRAGSTRETAEPCELGEIGARIDAAVQEGLTSVYIEIVAEPQLRKPPADPTVPPPPSTGAHSG